MATTIGKESDFSDVLKNLLQLEHDAIEAYESAVERLDDTSIRSQISGFLADHQRHVERLRPLVTATGETPPSGPGAKSLMTKGKVFLADIMGDKQILQAMKTNEDDTNTAYERAVEHKGKTPEAAPVIEEAFTDERRHRAWIEETIARL